MNYLVFEEGRETFPICLLVPQIRKSEIEKHYLGELLAPQETLVLDLHYSQEKKKTPKAEMVQYITEMLVPSLAQCQIQYVLCSDADYFKVLTGQPKAEANLGYVMDSPYGDFKVVYIPTTRAVFYDPEKVTNAIQRALQALRDHRLGDYKEPGENLLKFEAYPLDNEAIQIWLNKLLEMDVDLAIDIEAFSLRHPTAGIGSISFAWSKHEGIAFPVDYVPIPVEDGLYAKQIRNEPRRKMLREFFQKYLKKAIYHSISFDVYVLIYQLFMKDILDREGLLTGLDIMLRNWDCTKQITYLATNSCAGNKLGLKIQAQEFSGNWAMDSEDMKDIRRIPMMELLRYNLIDACSTHYVREKHWPTLVQDQQEELYEGLWKDSTKDIIEMQLTGMPINIKRVGEVKQIIETDQQKALDTIASSILVQKFEREYLDVKYADKMNAQWKKKRIDPSEANQKFNANSDDHKRWLMFDYLELDVINLTDSKQPSTDGETVAALLNRAKEGTEVHSLLKAFELHSIVSILLSNFMPSLENAVEGPDGWHYLFGNFNLGGTLSGRLSSSGPNLQNLPSTGKGHPLKGYYAKLIKTCFQAPPGWLFCGIDFSSLEDRISALTTKDPNKLKVYTDGYDGHSLRAYAYFPQLMPDIDGNSVDSINSVAKKYKPLRDRSKNPTFTLTYQGTHIALVKKYGFTLDEAKDLVSKYNALYQVSIDWVNQKLKEAQNNGYITGAFGLRLRTPLLKQTLRGTSKTPYEAEAEGRTAGNALGQSWCLLNSRAGNEFNAKVRSSKYRLDIKPSAQIHDAQYYLIRDDLDPIMFTNEHLVKAVQWQDHPEIYHDEVKLGGEFSVFYPNWAKEIGIPNGASEAEILAIVEKSMVGTGS